MNLGLNLKLGGGSMIPGNPGSKTGTGTITSRRFRPRPRPTADAPVSVDTGSFILSGGGATWGASSWMTVTGTAGDTITVTVGTWTGQFVITAILVSAKQEDGTEWLQEDGSAVYQEG